MTYIIRKEVREGREAEAIGLENFVRRLRAAELVHTVAARSNRREDTIGEIQDIAAETDEGFYLLDSRYNEVKIYDLSGRFISGFGGAGRSPGDFLHPEKMVRLSKKFIAVADRDNRLTVFEPSSTSLKGSPLKSFDYERSLVLGGVPEGMCAMRDTIYVQGASPAGIVHVYTLTDGRLRTFGELYRSESSFVQSQLSDGQVACSEEARMVVTMFDYLPVAYAYTTTGQLIWKSKLSNFRPMRVIESSDGGGRPSLSYSTEGVSDILKTLTSVPGGYIVAQVARRTERSMQAQEEYAELHTYAIDVRTGRGLYVGDALPPIYDATAYRLYTGVNSPLPEVKVYQLPAGDL